MNIIILGDKYLKGMKSKGCVGLIKYNNKCTFLDNQYNVLKSIFPQAKIAYVYGFDGKRFANHIKKNKYVLSLIYNENFDKFNTTNSLMAAKKFLDSDTLIVSGNIFLKSSLFKNFSLIKESSVFISKNSISNIGCVLNNNIVENISFDLTNNLYDMYFLSHKDAVFISGLLENPKYKNYFIFEIINKLIELGHTVSANISDSKIQSKKNMVKK